MQPQLDKFRGPTRNSFASAPALLLVVMPIAHCQAAPQAGEILLPGSSVRVRPMHDRVAPTLELLFPPGEGPDPAVRIELPESVLAQLEGGSEQLTLYANHHADNKRPMWRVAGGAIEATFELDGGCQMNVQARAEPDGLRITYKFTNRSNENYAWIMPATCVRQSGSLEDPLLERTYVHHKNGFELLASETPDRLEMTQQQWLPCRYRAFHSWGRPRPEKRKIQRGGLTSYTKSRPVDLPFVATQSRNGKWLIATYAKGVGSVWTNPARTCQHADPLVALKAGETKSVELKTFVLRGGLNDLLDRVRVETN